MIHHDDRGFASTQFLFFLLLLSAITLAIGVCLFAYNRVERHGAARNQTDLEIQELLVPVLDALRSDPTPDIHSYDDPLWEWQGKTLGEYGITIRPLSDRLNLNTIRKQMFEKTSLGSFLKSGKTAGELQQFREDRPLAISPEAYEPFFSQEFLEQYCTCYGWANINLIDEFAARKFAYTLIGQEDRAERLRTIIQNQRINRQPFQGRNLASRLGVDYQALFPFFNTEPLINVNFADPLILKALIRYPDYRIPESRLTELLERRDRGLGRKELLAILGIGETHPLGEYLGSITWFWEITIAHTGGRRSGRTVVCRLPRTYPDQDTPPIYTIIEQRFQ